MGKWCPVDLNLFFFLIIFYFDAEICTNVKAEFCVSAIKIYIF